MLIKNSSDFNNDENFLLFSLTAIPQLNNFFKYFGIEKGTPLSKTFKRLYDYLFEGAFDLYEEYLLYYSKEYNKFEIFLENYCNFSEKEIEIILKERKQKKIFYTNTSYGIKLDSRISRLLDTNYEEQRLMNLIEFFFKEY